MRQLPAIIIIAIAFLFAWLFFFKAQKCVEGGYAYPIHPVGTDTQHFGYPVVHLMNSGDSLYYCFYRQYLVKAFDESNLSLRPMSAPVYQLTYETAFGQACLFKLTSDGITVKRKLSGDPFPIYDSAKLTPEERFHLMILHEPRLSGMIPFYNGSYRRKAIDSIVKIKPEAGTSVYVSNLIRKAFVPANTRFTFETSHVSITRGQYNSILLSLANIGYWKMKPFDECAVEYLDGVSYLLEANTPCSYNFVIRSGCGKEDEDFTRICQKIIDLAGLGQEIKLPVRNKDK